MSQITKQEFDFLISRMDKHAWSEVKGFLLGRGITSFNEIFYPKNLEPESKPEPEQSIPILHQSPKSNYELLALCNQNIDYFNFDEKGFIQEKFGFVKKNRSYRFTFKQQNYLNRLRDILYRNNITEAP